MANPFAETPVARRRLSASVAVGALVGAGAFIALGGTMAGVRGEHLTIAGFLDAILVLGPGLLLLGYAAALAVGWPAYTLLRDRGELRWWQLLAIGAVAGALPALLFWRAAIMFALSVSAGAVGGLGAWAVLSWPSVRARVAV